MATLVGHNEQHDDFGSAITFTLPAGIQAGDLIVFAAQNSNAVAPPTESVTLSGTVSGFTTDWETYQPSGAGFASYIFVASKEAAGTESGGTVTVTFNNGGFGRVGELIVLRELLSSYTPTLYTAASHISAGTTPFTTSISQTPSGNHLCVTFEMVVAEGSSSNTLPAAYTTVASAFAASTPSVNVTGGYQDVTSGGQVGGTYTGTDGSGGNTGDNIIAVVLAFPSSTAPSAPTLTSPGNNVYLDASGGITFQSTFNSTDGANENAYTLRLKPLGSGSYSYWTGSAWQSTIIWPATSVSPAGTTSVGPITASISNGNAYNWSMASQEAAANLQGTFAADFTFNAQAPPSLTVTGPTGTVTTTNQPPVTYTPTPASGASVIGYRAFFVTAAQYTAGGWTAPTISGGAVVPPSAYAWDSGAVSGNPLEFSLGVGGNGPYSVPNGTTGRIYMAVEETGSLWSTFQSSQFTVNLDTPADPTVTAAAGTDPATGAPRIGVTVLGRGNALTTTQASFEDGTTTGWTAGASTVIANSTAQALDGTHSMSLTRQSATGAASASTPTGTSGTPVTSSQPWKALANFRTAVTGRTCTVQILWYQASGAASAVRASDTSSGVTDTTSGWTQAFLAVNSPSDAAFAAVVVSRVGAVANEVGYVDEVALSPGSSSVWARGGLVGSTTAAVLRSDGVYVRGASPTSQASIPAPGQAVTVYDYEAVPGEGYTYTAVVSAVVGGSTISSSASAPSGTVSTSTTEAWVLNPATPSDAIAALIASKPASTRNASSGTFNLLGNPVPSVTSDVFQTRVGTLSLITLDEPTADAIVALVTVPEAVSLLIRPPAAGATQGSVLYFTVNGAVTEGKAAEAGTGGAGTTMLNTAQRMVSVPYAEQSRPAV